MSSERGKLVTGRHALAVPAAPVETPDLPNLSWTIVNGVKEYRLIAEHVRREFLPNMWFDC